MPVPLLFLLTSLFLTHTVSLHILNSPLLHTSLTRCLQPGTTTISRKLRCHTSCALHLHRNLNSSIQTSFILTTPTKDVRINFPDSTPHTEALTLPTGSFNLVARSHNPHSTSICGTLTYAFQHQLRPCPVVLPTILAPSPSPSTTPSPSRRPSLPSNDSSAIVSSAIETDVNARQITEVTPRIVGGNIPDASLRTHMVAFIVNGAFVCSGSVISPRWVLTAAHCSIPRGARVSIGGATVSSGQFRDVQAAFPHPNFDFANTDSPYDIALILLDRPAPDETVFIRVNTNASNPVPGAYARVAGYGDIFRRSSTTLRQVDIPVVSMPKCKSDFSRANTIIARRLDERLQLCAGLNEGGCDACQGDSGGPLAFFDSAGHLVQIGIVSFGIGCARAGFPGVHTRLSTFEPWMKEIGAGYIRSSDGVTVFSTGSAEAAGLGGFSIAGLSTLQTILLLVGIVAVATVLLSLFAVGVVKKVRRNRARPTAPPPLPPQSPPPGAAQYHDTHGFGGFDPVAEQGLYPVYGADYQYDGYPVAQPPPTYLPPTQPPPTQPPPTQPPPTQPPPTQPPPVANDIHGGHVAADSAGMHENPPLGGQAAANPLYPQNTVLTH